MILPSIVTYQESHFDGVRLLWQEAFPNDPPWNAPEVAIPAKLKIQPDLFLVAIEQTLVRSCSTRNAQEFDPTHGFQKPSMALLGTTDF